MQKSGLCIVTLYQGPGDSWESHVKHLNRHTEAPAAICKRVNVRQIVRNILFGVICSILGGFIVAAFLRVAIERGVIG